MRRGWPDSIPPPSSVWCSPRRATLTGLAAMLNAVRFNQIPSNAGIGLEMKVIAAVVVGGVAIRGGRGHVAGTLLGVVLLGAIGPALTFLGVSAYWERAIQGAIILAAVAFDAVRPVTLHRWQRLKKAKGPGPKAQGKANRQKAKGKRQKAKGKGKGIDLAAASVPNGEWVLLMALVVEVLLFSAISRNFFDGWQLLRSAPAQRRAGAARGRVDAGDHQRRHRSLGRVDDGPRRGGVWRGRGTIGICRSPRRR